MIPSEKELKSMLEKSKIVARQSMNGIRMRAMGKPFGVTWPTCPVCTKQSCVPSDIRQMSVSGRCTHCETMKNHMTIGELRQSYIDSRKAKK